MARIDRLGFHQVAQAVAENSDPERRVAKTALYDGWTRNPRPKPKAPNGPDAPPALLHLHGKRVGATAD